MKHASKFLIVIALFCLLSFNVLAQDAYRLIGVAPVDKANSIVTPKLNLPIDPTKSSAIKIKNGYIQLTYDGTSSSICTIKTSERLAKEKWPRDFYEIGIFEGRDKLNNFLQEKFHASSSSWTALYLIENTPSLKKSPDCIGLPDSGATMHVSDNDLTMVDLPYFYFFKRQTQPFRNPNKNFDCDKAQTNVEHLICGSPDLLKLDAIANRGFVDLQMR